MIRGHFFYRLFYPKEIFVFYLDVKCIEYTSTIRILLCIKKHYFMHFFVFKTVEILQCILKPYDCYKLNLSNIRKMEIFYRCIQNPVNILNHSFSQKQTMAKNAKYIRKKTDLRRLVRFWGYFCILAITNWSIPNKRFTIIPKYLETLIKLLTNRSRWYNQNNLKGQLIIDL